MFFSANWVLGKSENYAFWGEFSKELRVALFSEFHTVFQCVGGVFPGGGALKLHVNHSDFPGPPLPRDSDKAVHLLLGSCVAQSTALSPVTGEDAHSGGHRWAASQPLGFAEPELERGCD